MQKPICAECLDSMARAKDQLLIRIACANCQQAQEDLKETAALHQELSLRRPFPLRCPQCGAWCWTKARLANHQQAHQSWGKP